eukprot:5049081-Amphidinium_carterae.1
MTWWGLTRVTRKWPATLSHVLVGIFGAQVAPIWVIWVLVSCVPKEGIAKDIEAPVPTERSTSVARQGDSKKMHGETMAWKG